MLRPLRALLAMLLAGLSPLAFADTGNVTVLEVAPSSYSQAGGPNINARLSVSSEFFLKNSDGYDFLVVFPAFGATFSTDDGPHAVGLHFGVRNKVEGIGIPEFDLGESFGRSKRLKGYIDIGTLRPGSPAQSVNDALEILAHEVAHQWSARAGQSLGLIGRDGGHWNFFLNSSASVLYGSEWRDNKDGTFTAIESRRRYSPLDLYLMGFLAPEEVPDFKLLTPGTGVGFSSTDIPPPDGTRISATASTLRMADFLNVYGARKPKASESQHEFRAAFVLLVPPGQKATAAQLAHIEEVRARWANQFFFLTRGRAFMQTERVDRPPTPNPSPSVAAGLSYLLAQRYAEGNWADHPETSLRDTEAALAALALFDGDSLENLVTGTADWLDEYVAVDSDERARCLRGLVMARRPDAPGTAELKLDADPLGIRKGEGRGYTPQYGATVLDTALVGLALTEKDKGESSGELEDTLAGLEVYLLSRQNPGDGGWPALDRGPSRVDATALVLQFLARRPKTAAVIDAESDAKTYLSTHFSPEGLFVDDLDLPGTTAEVVVALLDWGHLTPADGVRISNALLARQLANGSWEDSAYQTAQALRTLRLLQVPNLQIDQDDVEIVPEAVVEGESLTATLQVHNTGFTASGGTWVQVFDADHHPLCEPQPLASIAPGQTASLQFVLDTRGHGDLESQQLFVVIDPEGTLDETREDDNREAVSVSIQPAPTGVELFVTAGNVVSSPAKVLRVSSQPQSLVVTAQVGNAGLSDASGVVVSLAAGETVLASTSVDLPAQSSRSVELSAPLPRGPYPVDLKILVAPVPGEATGNNVVAWQLTAEPTVDLTEVTVAVAPTTVEQDLDVAITFQAYNAGTIPANGTSASVSIVAEDGVVLTTLPSISLNIPSGQTRQGSVSWKATHAGNHSVKVQFHHPDEDGVGDETGSAALRVDATTLPELELGAGAVSTSPSPPLEGQFAEARARVRNTGANAGPFAVDFYLGEPAAGGRHLGRARVESGLLAGKSTVASISFKPEAEDSHSLVVQVDPDDEVDERNDGNNTATLTLSPKPVADLVLTDNGIRPATSYPRAGETVAVTLSVFNQGGQTSAPANVLLYLGAPESNGKKIGQATLPAIDAGSEGEVELSWSTTGLSGTQQLVALVNTGTNPEQSTDNNRGERRVVIQSGAVALSEPYFSPNQDGVKDTTGIFYRLTAPSPSMVLITTLEGTRLRTIDVAGDGTLSGTATWDGRDSAGRLVRDGDYRVVALAGANGAQGEIGSVQVSVDTNHFPIEDVQDPALLRLNLLRKNLKRLSTEKFVAMPDDRGLIFYSSGRNDPPYLPCGFYFQPLEGGDPVLLTPAGTMGCDSEPGRPLTYAVSPDGKSIAYVTRLRRLCLARDNHNNCIYSDQNEIRLYSLVTRSYSSLRIGGTTHEGELIHTDTVQFTPDSQRVVYVRDLYYGANRTLASVGVATGDLRIEFTPSNRSGGASDVPYDFKLPRNTSRVALSTEPVGGNRWLALVFPAAATALERTRFMESRLDDFDWISDGARLLYSHAVPAQGNRLDLYDAETSLFQTLLVDSDLSRKMPVAGSPNQDAAVYAFSQGGTAALPQGAIGLFKPLVAGNPKVFAKIPDATGVTSLEWSPLGTFLYGKATPMGDWAWFSLANLQARIRAARPPGSTAVSFRGTAADLHFEGYTIAVRPFGASSAPVVIARRQVPVVDDVLATWTPPGPGIYEAVLTVRDRAGNVATHTTQVAWSSTAAIANLSVDPTFVSPNGDLIQDEAVVQYKMTQPDTFQFQVTNATGQVMYTWDASPYENTSGFNWDGRNTAGEYVADGNYTVGSERVSSGVVVDRTKPTLELTLGSEPGKQAPLFQSTVANAYDSMGRAVPVPALAANVSWKLTEANLADWKVEAISGADITELLHGSEGPLEGGFYSKSFGVNQLRNARLKVTARDLAGNSGFSAELPIPERLFLVGIGDASALETGGTLRYSGRTIPRIDKLREVRNEILATSSGSPLTTKITPSRFVFAPQRYAFALANSIGKPIVSYAVSYPDPVTGTPHVDYEHVEMLAEDAILWDARGLPEGSFELSILATDATGRVFTTKVPFDARARLSSCTDYRADEELKVVTRLSRGSPEGELLRVGARLKFIPEGALTEERSVEVDLSQPFISPEEIRYTTILPSGSLTKCNYRVVVQGLRQDGSEVEGSSQVNICGLLDLGTSFSNTVGGAEMYLPIAETFRQTVRSVEVHSRDSSGSWRFNGMLPGFNGFVVKTLPVQGCFEQVRLVARLADGSTVDSLNQPSFQNCRTEEKKEAPACATFNLTASRQGEAPLCAPQTATYAVNMSASTGSMTGWTSLEAELYTTSGARVGALPLTVTQATGTIFGNANLSTSSLPEGELQIRAKATAASGTVFRKDSNRKNRVIVDRTPVQLALSVPAPGEQFLCPVEKVQADGSTKSLFEFRGFLSDDWVESATLQVRGVSNPSFAKDWIFSDPSEPTQVTMSGVLQPVELSELPPGAYTLVAHARDASGGSVCLPSRTFHVSEAVGVDSLGVTHKLFSPGAGALGETEVQYSLDGAGRVDLVAVNEQGGETLIGHQEGGSGLRKFPWDGKQYTAPQSVLPDGVYTLRVDATDACGREASRGTRVTIDTTRPVAHLDASLDQATVGATLDVVGEASDANFKQYELLIGTGTPATFTQLASSTTPARGLLGTVNTAGFGPDFTLKLVVEDQVGLRSETSVTVHLQTGDVVRGFAVSPSLISPDLNGKKDTAVATFSLKQAAQVKLQLTTTGGAFVKTLYGPVELGTDTTTVTLTPEVFDDVNKNGDYRIQLVAEVAPVAGSTPIVDTALAALTLDVTPPTAVIEKPAALSSLFLPGRGNVVGTLSDAHLQSWQLTLSGLGGGTEAVVLASGNEPRNGTLAHVDALPEGEGWLELTTEDGAGNTATTKVKLTSDTTPPRIVPLQPVAKSYFGDSLLPEQVSAALTESHPDKVKLEFVGASQRHDLFNGSPTEGTVSASWHVALEPEGPAKLVWTATDLAGNTATTEIPVVVDRTKPLVALTSPSNSYLGESGEFLGTASDDNLDKYTLEIASGLPSSASLFSVVTTGTASVSGGRLGVLPVRPADGVYTARLTVIDHAKNSSVLTTTFIVDTQPPSAPLALTADVTPRTRNVHLTWTAPGDEDVVGYRLLRGLANGPLSPLGSTLLTSRSFDDVILVDGIYRYAVVAVDGAGLQSQSSNEARVEIDLSPPVAIISQPGSGAAVSGVVKVVGSALSAEDFKQYRLFLGAGTGTPLLVATMPVQNDTLGLIDLSKHPQDSVQTIRLEVEDLDGNVAVTTTSVKVDNQAPARPVIVSATLSPPPNGPDVVVTWNQLTETDLAGYLLYRNGVLVNADEGVSLEDLRPYLLASSEKTYTNKAVPDGEMTYELQAMDLAGNLSPRSAPFTRSIERNIPVATIVSPVSMARISEPVTVVAEVRDLDVKEVQFWVRAGSEAFTPRGPKLLRPPYTLRLDPSDFSSPAMEVKAVAVDTGNRVDTSPVSAFYFRDSPPAVAPVAVARVNKDRVTVGWTDSNPAGTVVAHLLTHDGIPLDDASERPVASGFNASSSAVGHTADAAYDNNSSSYWVSVGPAPQRWEMELSKPLSATVLVKRISASAYVPASTTVKADVWVRVRGLWVPIARDKYPSDTVVLDPPLEVEAVAYEFTSPTTMSVGLYEVNLETPPVVAASMISDPWPLSSQSSHVYVVTAMTAFGLTAESGKLTATAYTPLPDTLPTRVATPTVLVRGTRAPPNSTVEVVRNGTLVAQGVATEAGAFSVETPLLVGNNKLFVRARYLVDSVSMDSYEQTVNYQLPPDIGLTPPVISGSEVSFSFSVTEHAGTSAIAGFKVWRIVGTGSPIERTPSLGASARQFSDRLPNGSYRYTVVAMDSSGTPIASSNEVAFTLNVTPPEAPTGLTVTAPAAGGELLLSWNPVPGASGYELEWAASASGPFTVIKPLSATTYTHGTLTNGVALHYRVFAVDTAGNRSNPSELVSGTPRENLAPEAPRLTEPTQPGKPVSVSTATVSVVGFAEARSIVELFQNGSSLGSRITGESVVSQTPVLLQKYQRSSAEGYEVSADGKTAVYGFSGTSGRSIAVETLGTGELREIKPPSQIVLRPLPRLSPDKTRIAVTGIRTTNNTTVALIYDLVSETWKEALTTQSYHPAASPIWSTDSASIAYPSRDATGMAVLVVHSADTGAQKAVWSDPGAVAGGPMVNITAWTAPNRLVGFVGPSASSSQLRLQEWTFGTSVTTRTLLEAPYTQSEILLVSRSGTRLLLMSFISAQLVDLSNPSQLQVWTTPIGYMGNTNVPGFSPDSNQIIYMSNQGRLTTLDLTTRQEKQIAFGGPGRLHWTPEGLFSLSDYDYPERVNWGATFVFENVALVRGTNRFMAFARDDSGNKSPGSEPIEVALDLSKQPDLSVSATVQPTLPLAGSPAYASVTVMNIGGGAASNVELAVSVLGNDGSVRAARPVTLSGTIAPQGVATTLVPLELSGLSGNQELAVVVDPLQVIQEPERDNNQVAVPFVIYSGNSLAMATKVSPSPLEAGKTATATVKVANPGAPRNVAVELLVEDGSGNRVRALGPDELLSPIPSGAVVDVSRTIAADGLLAGSYQVVARARADGAVIATSRAPLEIRPDLRASLTLTPSRSTYAPGQPIDLAARVVNQSSNTLLADATLALEVRGPNGAVLHVQSFELPVLTFGASMTQVASVAPGSQPGTYHASAKLLLAGTVLATSETSYVVEGRASPQGLLVVTGAAGDPPAVRSGQDVSVQFSVVNAGTAPAESLVAILRVVEEGSVPPAIVKTLEAPVGTLAPGASWSTTVKIPTTGLKLQAHTVSLVAKWTGAGESNLSTARFRVSDAKVPIIASANLADGMHVQGEVLVSLRVVDDHSGVKSVTALVDGTRRVSLARVLGTTPTNGTWSARIPLETQGEHSFVFTAADEEGNDGELTPVSGNPISVTVVSDTLRPEITISGVEDGAFYGTVVSPMVVVSDANPFSSVITLDGRPFDSGTAVEADGLHRLLVEAHDKAGNRISASREFVVDRTKPIISVREVSEGAVLAGPVTPVVEVVDANLATKSFLLDDQTWIPGTAVTAAGSHELVVEATDLAGNSSSVTVSFIVDNDHPVIAISGVVDGATYPDAVTPVVTISDANLALRSVKLDGVDFASGSPVRADGLHTLVAEAWDAAGRHERASLSFRVQRFQVQVAKGEQRGAIRALALVGSGTCVPPQSEVVRLSSYLTAELQQLGGVVQVTASEVEFNKAMRSGRFNLVILAGASRYDDGCNPNTRDAELCSSVAERVFYGKAGLVALNVSSNHLAYTCREVLGSYLYYLPSSPSVVGWTGPLSPQGNLTAGEPADEFFSLQLDPGGAAPAAWYGSTQSGEVAVATHEFGAGRTVSFGFDPSLATPSETAHEVFQSALAWVDASSSPSEPMPLGVIPMELRAVNLADPVIDVRVREQLDPALSALPTPPEILTPALDWTVSLGRWDRAFLHYFVRLPDAVGQYEATTRAEVLLPDGPWSLGGWTSVFEVSQTGDDLFKAARVAVEALPTTGQDGVCRSNIEKYLNQVQARPVATASDVSANLRDLYQAAGWTRPLSTVSPVQTRRALDRLIFYWEARWSAL